MTRTHILKIRDYSIKRKLILLNMLVSGGAVLLACIVFGAVELNSLKRTMERNLSVQAQTVASDTASALDFDDRHAAEFTLSALKAAPGILAAGIYTPQGETLALYWRDGGARGLPLPVIPASQEKIPWFTGAELRVIQPVIFKGKRAGTVYIRSDLREVNDRLWQYAGTVSAALSLSLIGALLLSTIFQRSATEPILQLAETARVVSRDKEYSVRAAATGNHDEVTVLIDAFNEMLEQIQLRDATLQDHLARLHLLDQITRGIAERQDLHSVFQVVIRSLEDNLPIDFGCVCLYEPVTESLLTVVCAGVRSQALAMDLALTEQSQIRIDPNGVGRCLRGQLVYEPDISQSDFPFPQRLAGGGLRSMVAAPLQSENKVFGILIAARREANSFTSGDCEFLRQLSEHAALAAHQAQIYAALQQAYDDLRETQQAIMQQERLRALGQMASGIAHDINNALSPVALYTEALLEREPDLSRRTRAYLETTQRSLDDVAHTVARMQEFYRQREPQLTLLPVQLNRMVPQVLELTRARWSDMPQQRGIVVQMRTELAPDLPTIAGIECEIRESLVNLVFNAVDAMPDGGILTVRTAVASGASASAAPEHVTLEVQDTGIGMDEETRRRCLEPFFTTKGERGTGLGLAMVFGVTRRHNADVEIESTAGEGTIVRLSFPIAAATLKPVQPAQIHPTLASLHILLIDDDPLMIKSLRDTLEADGHAITTAAGGQAGVDVFRTAEEAGDRFDAVITDLGMPRMDGRQVAGAVKAVRRSAPVILLTGWGQRLVAEGDMPPHVDRILNKPPKLRELRAALSELVANVNATVPFP